MLSELDPFAYDMWAPTDEYKRISKPKVILEKGVEYEGEWSE